MKPDYNPAYEAKYNCGPVKRRRRKPEDREKKRKEARRGENS